jgi:hypothetical protein
MVSAVKLRTIVSKHLKMARVMSTAMKVPRLLLALGVRSVMVSVACGLNSASMGGEDVSWHAE